MDKINNKNAREKALLEEAYGNVYKEGQFWGRDDLVKKGKEKEKDHRRFTGPAGSGMRASIPPGKEYQKDVDKLLARGYTEEKPKEDEQNPDADTYDAQGEEPAEMVSLTPGAEEEEAGDGEDTQKPLFRVGQFVMGNDGEEIVTQVDEDGTVYTVVVTDKGNSYRPGDEQEDLTDAEEYAKYASMSSYRPAYGEY